MTTKIGQVSISSVLEFYPSRETWNTDKINSFLETESYLKYIEKLLNRKHSSKLSLLIIFYWACLKDVGG